MVKRIFSVAAVTELPRVHGKPTKECCRGGYFGFRDNKLDTWLPAAQPSTESCTITTLEIVSGTTLAQCLRLLLGLPKDAPMSTAAKLMSERHHLPTLPQIEEMVSMAERRRDASLRSDGYCNLVFVRANCGDTIVGRMHRDERRWPLYASRLKEDVSLGIGRRIHLANLDPSTVPLAA